MARWAVEKRTNTRVENKMKSTMKNSEDRREESKHTITLTIPDKELNETRGLNKLHGECNQG